MQKLIKQVRAYLNMSQTEFAEQLNVTFQTVNRWENGRAVPNKLAQSKMFDFCKEKHVPVYDMTLKRIAEESEAIKLDTDRVLLYHGSKSGIEGPIEPKSRKQCDFGKGFYMGTDPGQALTLICDYDKSKYNVVPVKSLKRINGSDTTYEYVNPLSGGVAYLVSGPGPVIIPNAEIKAMDEKGVSYEWKSDESGYIYVDCDELPEWTDDGRHGGRLLSIKSLSFGEKSIDEASLIADNTFIPYRVSLIAKLTTPSFNDYNSVRINWAAKRVYEGMQQDWPAQNYYYNISESDLKELSVQKVNLSLPVPEGYAVCSDSIDMSSAVILHSPLVSRHISYDKDGYPAFPTYAYVVVGDGKNPSTVKVHENVFKNTGTATNPNLAVKYQADYGCRTSSFDNGRDMVIAPELCEFGQLDTTRSRYVVKIGETILFLMFDTKTFGHIYSSEVYDVPESERTRSDLGKLYAFRRYENLADFTERLKINYEVTGRIGVIGYLNEILISNSTDYGLKNFNETKDSVQFEIKNAYDKFTVNYYNLYARTIRGGFLFPLFDSARGKFSYHMGDSTATVTIEKKKFTIPAEVQEYIK